MSAKNINYLRSLEIRLIAVSLGLGLDAQQSSFAQQPPSPQPEATPPPI